MTLLAPLALLGVLGLALPIAAHLLGREPPQRIEFAAMRFLSETDQSVTHRRAVQDLPLLIVRLLVLLLIVLALARPSSTERSAVAVVGEPHDAVILLDGSRSMELSVGGRPLLAHAVERIEALLSSLPPGSKVGLVIADPDAPSLELSADPDRVAEAVAQWQATGAPRPGAWTLADALPAAASILTDADGRRPRVVYAVGDETERGLGSLPEAAEGGVLVVPVPAVDLEELEPAPIEHVAIEAASWAPAPDLDPRAVRIEAVVARHGPMVIGEPEPGYDPDAIRQVGVALRIADAEVTRTTVDLPPDGKVAVEFSHTLLEETGAVAASVVLVDHGIDPMPSDDRRDLWLSADDAVEVLVVNGDPSELRAHDEVFFLATAAAAADEGRTLETRSLAPEQLEATIRDKGRAAFDGIDVLILANVRAPAQDVAPIIVEMVRRGMGLWISVGDRVEADAYNARFDAVLPLRMREAVQVGTAPGRQEARVEGVAPADLSHPAFRALGGDLGLSGARARRIMLLEPDPTRDREIALSFSSGAPALLTRAVDGGRVALLTTTVDRDWADLPLRPGFVPMVASMIDFLADARAGVAGTQIHVGQERTIRSEGPISITTPDGRQVSVAPDDGGAATFHDTFQPGHYRARTDQGESVFAVEVDAAESDTTRIEAPSAELEDGEGRSVAVTVPRWREVVFLALVLLLLETILRVVYRRRQPGRVEG